MDNIRKIVSKIAALPEEFRVFMESDFFRSVFGKISAYNGLSKEKFGEIIDALIVNDFPVNNLDIWLEQEFQIPKQKAISLAKDILGKFLLPANNAFPQVDFNVELSRLGGKTDDYTKYQEGFAEVIEDKNMEILDELLNKYERLVDPKEELKAICDIFNNKFADVLLGGGENALAALNAGLLYVLNSLKDSKEQILRALLDNRQPLFKKGDAKAASGGLPLTIADWIQDFIKIYGTENFNNLKLMFYSVNSKNGKKLEDEKRRILRKLLIAYRNIKFYPEIFRNVSYGEWRIVPTDEYEFGLTKARYVSGPPKTEEEHEIEELKDEEGKYKEGGLEQLALEEEINKKRDIEDMEIMAKKYKDNSLEKKALLEEIARLKKR